MLLIALILGCADQTVVAADTATRFVAAQSNSATQTTLVCEQTHEDVPSTWLQYLEHFEPRINSTDPRPSVTTEGINVEPSRAFIQLRVAHRVFDGDLSVIVPLHIEQGEWCVTTTRATHPRTQGSQGEIAQVVED